MHSGTSVLTCVFMAVYACVDMSCMCVCVRICLCNYRTERLLSTLSSACATESSNPWSGLRSVAMLTWPFVTTRCCHLQGFEILSISRVPWVLSHKRKRLLALTRTHAPMLRYISKGDSRQAYYILSDAIIVMKLREPITYVSEWVSEWVSLRLRIWDSERVR